MKTIEACCWLLLVSSLHLKAETDDTDFPKGPAFVSHDFASWVQVGNHKFIFEGITLSEVIHALGAGTIQDNGSPGAVDYTYSVDYTDGSNLIRFLSDSDMGGEKRDLEGILIEPISHNEDPRKDPLLTSPITLPFGTPEPSLASLEDKLGTVSIQKGRIYYEFKGKRPIKDEHGKINLFDVTTTLRAGVTKGKLTSLVIWHVTSG